VAEGRTVTYSPTEDQELIRTTARRFLEDRIGLERVRELMMSDEGFDRVLWKEMADLGWTGLAIAEDHGGQVHRELAVGRSPRPE
jgi:alkylation response protein AidB-like acyl-CoA dehydrogenase